MPSKEKLLEAGQAGFLRHRAEHPEAYDRRKLTRSDPELSGMLLDRRRLLKQLSPLLRRVGASHPQRSAINADRSFRRKEVRDALRLNAEAIASRLLEIDDAG